MTRPMIRAATLNDRDAMVRMAGDFLGAAQLSMPIDANWLGANIAQTIQGESGFALVLDFGGPRGMLCGALSYSPAAPVLLAQEQCFWIDPACRGGSAARQMIDAFCAWARARGCHSVSFSSLDRRCDTLLRRRGFQMIERSFVRLC